MGAELFRLPPAEWAALRTLLDEALALPALERAAWLDTLDPARAGALKPRLAQLLAHADATGTAERLLETLGGVETASFAPPPVPSETVGPYRLLRPLGEGGMGSVWLAVRTDMLQGRQVALKLPHGAWRRAGLAERMAREREILATLEHPNIARLYDAGVGDDGQPWLALEYVEGERLDLYARQRGLDVPARLRLFLQVAQAVAHAHANLVVHRDLKPANILVTADGAVKLLDFGIAKLLEGEQAPETELTQAGGRALTPDYAAPEQILGRPVGTGADVYALGVVLFELLADVRPYTLRRGTRAELEEAIVHADVPRPSSVAPAGRRRVLRGDLDTIVLKALKAVPAERYGTVLALADDVRRCLEHRPVLAQPDSAAYRARRFVRRHAVALAVGSAMAAVLVAGSGVALWQAAQARAAQQRAEAVRDFVGRLLLDANPFTSRGREPTVEALLLAGRQRLPPADGRNAALRVELLTLVGTALQGLGKYDSAESALQQAADEGRRALGEHHPLTLGARVAMTSVLRFRGREDAVRRELDELLPALRANGDASAPDLALALSNVAHLAIDQRRFDEARNAAGEAHRISERVLGPLHDSTVGYALLAAITQRREGDPEGALRIAQQARDLVVRAYGTEVPHARVLDARFGFGAALGEAGRYDEAVAELSDVLRQVQALMGPDASMGGFVAASLARYELARGNPAASLRHAQMSLAIKRTEVAEDSYAMGMAQFHVARAQLALHEPAAALQALAVARAAIARNRGEDSMQVADLELMRARALALDGRLAEARQVAARFQDRLLHEPASPPKVRALLTLAQLARWSGEPASAATLLAQAAAAVPDGTAAAALREPVIAELARASLERGDARAAELALAGLRFPSLQAPVTTPDGAERQLLHGRALLAQGRVVDAMAPLQAAASYWRERLPASHWAGESEHWLAVAMARQDTAAAAAARERASRLLARSPFPADRALARLSASARP